MSMFHDVRHSRGIVSAGDAQTAQAGAIALERGGNAVDAAVSQYGASCVKLLMRSCRWCSRHQITQR